MEIEEAKKVLLIIQDKILWELQFKNDIRLQGCVNAIDTVIHELVAFQNLLDEKNEELEHLQKENEQLQTEVNSLKEIDLTTVHIKGVCDEKERWRNKIREMLEDYKKGVDCTYCNNTCSRYILCTNLQDLLKEE